MVRAFVLVLLAVLPALAYAQPADTPAPPKVEQVDNYEFIPVVWEDGWRHSSRWALVVDTSDSIFGTITGVRENRVRKLLYAISRFGGSDHMKFCAVAFNDKSPIRITKYFSWHPTGPATLEKMEKWLNLGENQGTMSYGVNSIRRALKQQTKDLTVIIISDGGFTEGGDAVKKAIAEEQALRVANGWGEAIVCTIGIENHTPSWYPKPPDAVCQSWMKDIGTKGKGGYFYVKRKE